MNPALLLQEAAAAARAAGATRGDVFHRSSRTHLLVLEAGRQEWSERSEEGVAVRAWANQGEAALVAATGGIDPRELGRRAAQAAGITTPARRAGAAPVEGEPVAPAAGASADLPICDPEFLRASRRDLEHRLRELAAAAGVACRAGLPRTARAVLRLATMDRHLLAVDGRRQPSRSTLVSFHLRFPSAFGLSSIEIVSRRLADLDTAPLVPWLAAHPTPGSSLGYWRAMPAEDGDTALTLAPKVMASLMVIVAARAAATGKALTWPAPAVLRDDPLIPWGPGSTPVDGEGNATRAQTLAGPECAGEECAVPVALAPLRMSFREPPRPLPTNLVLQGLPAGSGAAAAARLHLLDVVTRQGGRLLVRGTRRRNEGGDQPVLVEIPARIETYFSAGATAGPAQPFLVADAFISAPAVTIPGWNLRRLS